MHLAGINVEGAIHIPDLMYSTHRRYFLHASTGGKFNTHRQMGVNIWIGAPYGTQRCYPSSLIGIPKTEERLLLTVWQLCLIRLKGVSVGKTGEELYFPASSSQTGRRYRQH